MDFIRLLEIVSLSCRSACSKLGILSSVMHTSSEVGLREPPEIIEKWINAKMF